MVEVIPILISLKNSALQSMTDGGNLAIRGSGVYNPANKDALVATYDNGRFGHIAVGDPATPLLSQQAILRDAAQLAGQTTHAHLNQQDEYQRLFRDTISSGSQSFLSADSRRKESFQDDSEMGSPSASSLSTSEGKWGWFGF